MTLLASVIYGILGLFIGYMIPLLSMKVIDYKKASIKAEFNQSLIKYMKIILGIFNGLAWFYTFSHIDNLLVVLFISLQITLGIIFAYIDIKIRLIPNELVLVLLCMGIVYQSIFYGLEGILGSIMCMIFIMIIFTAVAGFMGFGKVGAGDVKLAGAIGFTLGYPTIITAMGAMAIILLVYILLGLAFKKIQLTTMLPLAPFLSAGYILALFTIT